MASEQAIPYPIGTGYEAGDGAASSNGVIFNNEYDANYEVLSKLINGLYYDGNDALDKASGAASCEIYLRTSEASIADVNSRKGATVGQYCQVEYTTGGQDYVFDVLVQEDGSGYPFIQFDSLDCVSRTPAQATAAVADYSAAAFIDALDIGTKERPWRVYVSRLITQYNAPEAVTGASLATDTAAADVLATEYNVTKTDVELAVITGTGEIKAGQVSASSLDKAEALSDDSPLNLLKDGTTRDFLEGVDIAFGLNKYGAATSWAEETTIIPYAGKSSQEFVAAGSNVGIEAVLAGDVYATELVSENVTVIATVYSTVINNVKIGIEDDVTGLITDTPTLAAATWTEISATVAVTAGAVDLTAVILAAGAGTIYVTDISVYRGDSVFKHYPSPEAVVIHNVLDNRFYNYIPFGDLASELALGNDYPGHAWLNGPSTHPICWGGTGASVLENGAGNFLYANASWEMQLDVGEYYDHYIGFVSSITSAVQECLGKSFTFACWILKDGANTQELDLEIITDGTGGTTTSNSFAVNDYSNWAQVAVTLDTVPSDATYIRCRIINNGAAQINVYVDGLMGTQTKYPIAFTSVTPWDYIKHIYGNAGAVVLGTEIMATADGIQAPIPVGVNILIYGLTVYEDTAGAGDDIFFPFRKSWNGAVWVTTDMNAAISITLGNGEDYESAGDISSTLNLVSSGALLGAKCTGPIASNGSDAIVTIHGLSWGI